MSSSVHDWNFYLNESKHGESVNEKNEFELFCKKYLNSTNGFYADQVSASATSNNDNSKIAGNYFYGDLNANTNTYQYLSDYSELHSKPKRRQSLELLPNQNETKPKTVAEKKTRNLTIPSIIYHFNNDKKNVDKQDERKNENLTGVLQLTNQTSLNLNKETTSGQVMKEISYDYLQEQYPSVYLQEDKTSKEAQILKNFKNKHLTGKSYENFVYLNHKTDEVNTLNNESNGIYLAKKVDDLNLRKNEEVKTKLDAENEKSSVYSDANLFNETIWFEAPKKKTFNQEFSRRKTEKPHFQQLTNIDRIPIKINSSLTSNRNNDHNSADYLSPYHVVKSTDKVNKPTGWLGLKVAACGLSKLSRLPIPSSNYLIESGDFGDDAAFLAENVAGDAIGIADGATGNCMLGYDPGDFSRNLMKICSEFFIRENKMSDAKSLLLKAYECVQNKTCYGSCTACVMTLDHTNNTLTASNVGDSGYCIVRNGQLVFKSTPDRITNECPRQLDSYPWKEETRRMGISYTNILGQATTCESFKVEKNDIIIASSDGLYDNLEFNEIEDITKSSESVKEIAERLVNESIRSNRKPDDILVLVARVVDNKESSILQKFSKAPYDF